MIDLSHVPSPYCPCAQCAHDRSRFRSALLMFFVVMGFFTVIDFDEHDALPAKVNPPISSLTPQVAAAGAGKRASGVIQPRVAPSVENVRIGAPAFVSTWRWQLRPPPPGCRGAYVCTRRLRRLELVLSNNRLRRPWCARESNDA